MNVSVKGVVSIVNAVRGQDDVAHLINLSVTLIDEGRQNVGGVLVVDGLGLPLGQLVPEALGLPFHFLGESVAELVFNLTFEHLHITLTPLPFR